MVEGASLLQSISSFHCVLQLYLHGVLAAMESPLLTDEYLLPFSNPMYSYFFTTPSLPERIIKSVVLISRMTIFEKFDMVGVDRVITSAFGVALAP
jgi:hypothetical protein